MTNAVIRKVLAAVAAVFFTVTGARALTIETTTDMYGHTFSYYIDQTRGATIVRADNYRSFSGQVALPATCGGQDVIAVDEGAFAGCTGLTAVILPNSVEEIGDYAFANCTSLRYVGRHLEDPTGDSKLPDKTKSIGVGAFDNTLVTGIDYGKGVLTGGDGDEKINTSVKTLVIPGWVYFIPDRAFKNFVALESVEIQEGLLSIGESAFEGCTSLKKVTIGGGPKVIRTGTFAGCKELETIELPATVGTYERGAFSGCTGIREVHLWYLYGLEGWCGATFEDESANPLWLVRDIAPESVLYRGLDRVETLEIPGSVQEIKPYAFAGLRLTGDLKVSSWVTKIGESAFRDLRIGGDITFGNGLEEIGKSAFYNLHIGGGITFGERIEVIDDEAFQSAAYDNDLAEDDPGRPEYLSIELPSSLKKVGRSAFKHFAQLGAVKLGGVREIGEEAFAECHHLGSLDFGATPSVTNIGRRAFSDCYYFLRSVTIPASVTCMGTQVFSGDSELAKVCYEGDCPQILQRGSEKVNDGTIAEFASYVRPGSRRWSGEFSWTEKPLSWEGAALGVWNDDGLLIRPNADGSEYAVGGWIPATSKLVTLPAEVGGKAITSIAPRAFEGDSTITGVTVEEGICDVGELAFSESYVADVILPNSVSNVGAKAFWGILPYMRSLAVGEGLESIAADAFDGWFVDLPSLTVYAPLNKVEMLQTAFVGPGYPRDIGEVVFKTDEAAPEIATASIRIDWNTMGGWYASKVTFPEGVTLAEVLPSAPNTERLYYHFKGWSFSPVEWQPITDPSKQNMILTDNQTFYAWWTEGTSSFRVTWNAMGGTVSPTTTDFAYGTKVSAIIKAAPTPERTGWTFGGWYWDEKLTDPLNDDDPLAQGAIVDYDCSFYAKWEMSVDPQPVDPQPVDPQPVNPQPVEPPVNPDAPGVIADPAPTAEDVVSVKEADVASALSYNGYLAKGDEIVGSVTVKVAKKGKVTATVQLPDGTKALKKFSYAGTLGADGSATLACKKNGGTMTVAVGAKAISGTVTQGGETYVINGRLGTKDTLASADQLLDKKVWSIALHTPTNGVPHALVNGYSALTVTGAKKGKVKVSGFLADGTKVSVTAQGTVFDSCVIVPVNVALYKGKAGGFSLKLKIEGEKIEVGNVSDWTAVVDGRAVTVTWDAVYASAKTDIESGATFHLDEADIPFNDFVPASADGTPTLPNGVKVDSVGGKWSLPKAGKVALKKDKSDYDTSKFGENPAGLKLSYVAKTGAFKGSFSLYRQTAPGKMKKEKATVNGVVVKGVGYGSAVIKKVGAMPVTVGAGCGECRP